MSITDELREYAKENECESYCKLLFAIADRIDERHSVKVERLEKYRAAVDAMLKEYVKLPVDADGVPIYLGDSVALGDEPFEVRRLELYDRDSWDVLDRFGEPFSPRKLHHVKPDSWERIIEDALTVGWPNGDWSDVASAEIHDRFVERCRRLAEK